MVKLHQTFIWKNTPNVNPKHIQTPFKHT